MWRYLVYVLFLVLFVLTACSSPMPEPDTNTEYTYLALGDSYTIGERVTADQRWGVQLAQLLRTEGIAMADPVIIARTGWTTGELLTGINNAQPTSNYDLVSLLIGVNNQYRGQSLDVYRSEFRQLVQWAIKFGKSEANRVIILSVPDWGVTPFAQGRNQEQIAQEIDAFNAVGREEALKAGVTFIDITPLSRQAANNLSYIADDNLHFSGKMYRTWAEMTMPAVRQILK